MDADMVYPASPHLFFDLEYRIKQRTGWRVRNLAIEILSDPERAVLRGQATTPLAGQIAHNLLCDFFPGFTVENAIEVDNAVEVLPGMPLN
jgi:hypothetical protein